MEFISLLIAILVILLVVGGIFAYLVRLVPQAEAYVIERLGAYHATWTTGLHILIPISCYCYVPILLDDDFFIKNL
jgi:regulator of protease activity HflC (stomatin/prohibitin superfamily)